jgi:hypothetical protein
VSSLDVWLKAYYLPYMDIVWVAEPTNQQSARWQGDTFCVRQPQALTALGAFFAFAVANIIQFCTMHKKPCLLLLHFTLQVSCKSQEEEGLSLQDLEKVKRKVVADSHAMSVFT